MKSQKREGNNDKESKERQFEAAGMKGKAPKSGFYHRL